MRSSAPRRKLKIWYVVGLRVNKMINFIDFDLKLPAYSHLGQWTESAIECYQRGCNCQDCPIPHPTESCYMKTFVLLLVKTIGTPNNLLNEKEAKKQREKEILIEAQKLIDSGSKKG
jgi:hypothetical protein